MKRMLVFAGTTEGRRVLELLADCDCETTACAATEYGGEVLEKRPRLTILAGRLDQHAIEALLNRQRFDCVLDATHPFAAAATENIRAACELAATPYLRILRDRGGRVARDYVKDAWEAARVAGGVAGAILLTTGSKELDAFTSIPGYASRVYPRVLPTAESLERCLALGFPPKNIICMQGPFTEELNLATLRQIGATCLVTKDSGVAGGFAEKCAAAQAAGARLVVIGRPDETEGATLDELPQILVNRFGLAPTAPNASPYFPLFVPLARKKAVLIGAGTVAKRRARALLPFGCELHVIAPEACEDIVGLAREGKLYYHKRCWRPGDCLGAAVAVAATDDRSCNRAVYEECAAAGVPVSVADRREECTFYFPGVARRGGVTVGVTAGGTDHRLAKETTQQIRELLERFLPETEEAEK